MVHIMRYQNGRKSLSNQSYPSQISIGEQTFTLQAVIHHLGDTLNSGHYTCAANRDGWKMYNDAKTRKINTPSCPSKTVYLLLYIAREDIELTQQNDD